VTEMITGVDLIQEQILAAQGEVLRFKQEDIQLKVRPRRPLLGSRIVQPATGRSLHLTLSIGLSGVAATIPECRGGFV